MENEKQAVNYNNRISIFKHLTVDELTQSVNEELFSELLNDHYDEFVSLCEDVKEISDKIKYVTCFIDNGVLTFDIEKKK